MSQRRSLNQSQRSAAVRSEDVFACVRYILFREGSKLPFLRANIANHLTSTCEMPKNQINDVIDAAEKYLLNVYGYKLEKVDQKSYILVTKDPCDIPPSPLIDVKEQRLLNVILTHIFMSGGSVSEENMWAFLTKAKLMEETDSAVRNLVAKKFTSQLYLSIVKSGQGELVKTMFEWGPRASKETSKMFMLKKIAEALGKSPDHWCEQYKIADSEASLATQSVQQ